MGIEQREKRIGAHTYRVTQLGAKAGRNVLVRLVKLGGPGVGALVGGIGRGGKEGTADSALALGVGDALHALSLRLREDEVGALMDEFALHTVVVKPADIELRLSDIFDDHFAGRYDEMLAWTRFCMEVNFSSFFVGSSASATLGKLWKMLSALPSPPTSTGTSGESPAASASAQAGSRIKPRGHSMICTRRMTCWTCTTSSIDWLPQSRCSRDGRARARCEARF